MSGRWIVLGEPERRRFGGDLRRAFIFAELAARTRAEQPRTHRPTRRWWDRRRARLASADLLTEDALALARTWCHLVALDVHDDPVAQRQAFGEVGDPARQEALVQRFRRNIEAFELLVAPSATFADLARLPVERRIIASNGTDTAHLEPGPWPGEPTVAMISASAPGRGIETLIDAAVLVRERVPDLRLLLWLVAPGATGVAYLDVILARIVGLPWVEVAHVPYATLGATLATATVMCIPHPPGAYLDSALPVKLFDSMAAGRPVVVTPRFETAEVIRRHDAGLVAAGDAPEDLAAGIVRLLEDEDMARRLGMNGRRAAEAAYDWRIIGGHVADEVLARLRG